MYFTFYFRNLSCPNGDKINTCLELSFDQLISLVSPSKLCKILNSSDFVYEGDKPVTLTRKNIHFVSAHDFVDYASGHSFKEPKKD